VASGVSLRPWFERSFFFGHLFASDFPFLVERLRGAPARAADKLLGASLDVRARPDPDSWSAQEHVGHLLELDSLHDGRLDDYAAGTAELRGADLQNRRTHEASFNAMSTADLLEAFRAKRARLVARLVAWDPRLVEARALHPRLRQPMRVVDMAYFAAEHDDHHLAWIESITHRPTLPSSST